MQNAKKVTLPDQNSISLVILYRSLYILKKKFQIYQKEINSIYLKNAIAPEQKHIQVKMEDFGRIMIQVLKKTSLLIPLVKNPNELYFYNYINENKREEVDENANKKVTDFLKNNVGKYNELYYNKKIYANQVLDSIDKKEKDVTAQVPIVQYDKKGNIVYSFDQLKEINGTISVKSKDEFNLDDILANNNFIFIETLPVILADFIQANNNYAIIDLEGGELSNEVQNLFDEEILRKIQQSNLQIKNYIDLSVGRSKESSVHDLLQEQLKIVKNIQLYENLFIEKQKNFENVAYLQKMLDKLREENKRIEEKIKLKEEQNAKAKETFRNSVILEREKEEKKRQELLKKIKPKQETVIDKPKKSQLSQNQKINMCISEIFHFYSNQHHSIGKSLLFDDIYNKPKILDKIEFSRFCIDFNIKIPQQKLVEVFKKTSLDNKNLNYKEFCDVLLLIGREIYKDKQDNLVKKINRLRTSLKEVGDEEEDIIMNNTRNIRKRNQIKQEINSTNDEIRKIKALTYEGIYNKFLQFLGIDEEYSFRTKLKGFNKGPFPNSEERKQYLKESAEKDKLFKKRRLELSKYIANKKLERSVQLKKEVKPIEEIKIEIQDIKLPEGEILQEEEVGIIKEDENKEQENINIEPEEEKKEPLITEEEKERMQKELEEQKKKEEKEAKFKKMSWENIEGFKMEDLELTDDEKDIFSQSDISDDELQFLNKFIQKKPNLKKELRPPEEPKEKSIVIEQTPFVTQKKQKYKPKRNFIKLAEAKRKDSGTKQSITRPIRQTRNRKTEEKDTLPTIKKSSIIKSAEKSKELQKMENLINNRQKNLFLLPSISRFNYLSQSNKVIRKYRYQT